MSIFLALSAAICMFIFHVFFHVSLRRSWWTTWRMVLSMNACVFLCVRWVRKTNNLGVHTQRFLAYRQSLQFTKFCLSSFDNAMPRLWQSWASVGKLHVESSFGNSTTWSKVREDQEQARFQEQSWKATQKERLHQRESEAYTKTNVRKTYCKKRQNDSVAGWSQVRKRLQKSVADPMMAYEKLERVRFFAWTKEMFSLWVWVFGPPVKNSNSCWVFLFNVACERVYVQRSITCVRKLLEHYYSTPPHPNPISYCGFLHACMILVV